MTNKKFKLAAMSLALTACVAASPLAANAESTSTEATSSTPVAETSTDETKQNPADESKPDTTNEAKQESTDESKQESTGETKQESTDESKQESTNESKQESADESKQESTNESKQESTDESKQESANETKQDSTNETKQESTNETKQDSANKTKQDSADETKQNPADETKQDTAVENNNPAAAAPVAKAPLMMTASLAAAPAAPTTPTEENTAAEDVATINGKGYKSFDEAVSDAADGDTIEVVVKEATSTGINLRDKKLTIKGKTVTTTTDSGTEEKTTVKPKLTFKDGISIKNAELILKNLDVDMTGVGSTPNVVDGQTWMGICLAGDSTLTLDETDLLMDGENIELESGVDPTGGVRNPQAIYLAGNGHNILNIINDSHVRILNYFNAIKWDGVQGGQSNSQYNINITGNSSLTADHNEAGIVGRESLDVLVEDSALTVTNCTARYPGREGRDGTNGCDLTVKNSTVNVSDNAQAYGIYAHDFYAEDSTITANNNGYSGIRIGGKGQFVNSNVTVTGTLAKGNAALELANVRGERGGRNIGSLEVRNSALNISGNGAVGIRCNSGTKLDIDDISRVTIKDNHATNDNGWNTMYDHAGGLLIFNGASAKLGTNTVINNNHADTAGDDIVIQPGGTLTFSAGNAGIGDILKDCGDGIDGWYIDAEGQRWDFHGDPSVAQKLLDSKDVALVYNSDGTYTITTGREGLALKAAHAELPAPEPDPNPNPNPDPEPKPDPKPGPDTPVTPEDPQLPPVQDARADTPDSPVLPANPTNPAVQDAHALPQTGTSLFAALAMALSGFALTIAGAWASLLGKNSRH